MRFKVIVSFAVVVFIVGVLGLKAHGQEFIKAGGCTTILIGKNATADGSVLMGHNEDMGNLSGRLFFQPEQTHREKKIALSYVTIPQVHKTFQYWASGNSKPVADKHFDGGWILCGMNGYGVSMGCNTMSTREERIPKGKGIMRYSIRQLILERSKTARDAVTLVGKLIDTYGQSDSPVAYCITDRNEAWVVETTYRHWVARRIPESVAVPVYVGASKVPGEYTDASYKEDHVSAWWQFERLQRLVYPCIWKYEDAFLEVRKKLNRFQKTIFKKSVVVEEKALKLWKQGDIKRTKERLTNHTYKMLKDALKETKHLNGPAKHAK